MLTDIQIAQSVKLTNISEIAASLGIEENDYELYGNYKAKLSLDILKKNKNKPDGKLILVTATNPTPAGEGKTTTTVGLGQAFARLGKRSIVALREPSLGPVMGIKGGAAGGGYSQVLPMEDINLHFTGDIHAVTTVNNLISAALDNHIYHGNDLGIDPKRVLWKRCIDMNDRSLRNVIVGMGKKTDGITREDHFVITAASEIMAVLCLSADISDLKKRIGNCILGYSFSDKPVYVKDLEIEGAAAALLKDAIKPNLVQTVEHTPALMHGGPFANIAHGCNSLIATRMALKLADYVITEAGFGADLGAEKFFDIKVRAGHLKPSMAVIVTTIRTLKYNGGVALHDLKYENIKALKKGLPNLERHIENLGLFNIPVIAVLNVFDSDTNGEIAEFKAFCENLDIPSELSYVYEKGGEGAEAIARTIISMMDVPAKPFRYLYDIELPIEEKIEKICTSIYRAGKITYSPNAAAELARLKTNGFSELPVCIAKTQYSFSDDPKLLGAPTNFEITIDDIHLSNGAGFIVVQTGNIMIMPGLPKEPAAKKIDIDSNMVIKGLF
jgi:formate--tetrahydrofolate ligase